MARRKKTKWEKNREAMIKARDKALAYIDELKTNGYKISDYIIDNLNTISKRPTTAQRREYIKYANRARIRRSARKPELAQKKSFPQPGGKRRTITYKPSKSDIELGRAILKDLKYQAKFGFRKSITLENQARILDQIGKLAGIDLLSGESPQKARKHMPDILKKIRPTDLGRAIQKADDLADGIATNLIGTIYQMGATPEARQQMKRESIQAAKDAFKRNVRVDAGLELSDSDIENLYDFFDAEIWKEYRRDKTKYISEDVITLAREVKDNPNIDIKKFLNILAGASSMDDAIKQYKNS